MLAHSCPELESPFFPPPCQALCPPFRRERRLILLRACTLAGGSGGLAQLPRAGTNSGSQAPVPRPFPGHPGWQEGLGRVGQGYHAPPPAWL